MTPKELDAVLQGEYPLHIVGKIAPFEPLTEPGSRILLHAGGLSIEACNGVFHSIAPLAVMDTYLTMPYGEIQHGMTAIDPDSAAKLPHLIWNFVVTAARASPSEAIMLIVKAPGKPLRCVDPGFSATTASLAYDLSQIEEGEEVIADIHSHGLHSAFFSPRDDQDDRLFRGNLKNSIVIGRPTEDAVEWIDRWVSRGHISSESTLRKIEKVKAKC